MRLKQCYGKLEALFPEYELNYVPKTEPETSGESAYISVAMLNGDSISVELNSAMTVFKLRAIVKEKLGVPLENQQLIYNGKEIKVSHEEDNAHQKVESILIFLHPIVD